MTFDVINQLPKFKLVILETSMLSSNRIMLSVVMAVLYTVRFRSWDFYCLFGDFIMFKIESIDFCDISEVSASPNVYNFPLKFIFSKSLNALSSK